MSKQAKLLTAYGAFYGLRFTFLCVCGILLFLLPVNLALALDFGTNS